MKVKWCAETALYALMASALLLSACGGGGGGGGGTSSNVSNTPPTLQSISVTPGNPTTALNARIQLMATGLYSDNSTMDITTSVTWGSGSTGVATVGAGTGLVTPVAGATAGQQTVITASSGVVSGSTSVTLSALPVFSIANCTTATSAGCEPLAFQQWGLLNTGQNGFADTAGVANAGGTLGTDINANAVYSTYGYTGWGVTVGVVDSGMEIAHEDLKANVVPGGSWNFINNTTDPTTTSTTEDHGTMVSGLIAMSKNGIGGMGVAPNAQLKGFNLLATGAWSLANEIASLGGSAASPNSTDVSIFNQSWGTTNAVDVPVDPTVEGQYAYGTSTLRGGKGALYVKSAGNGFGAYGVAYCGGATTIGISCQNANFDPDNTLPYNIVMGALNAKGVKSSYSTAGSALWAGTPGGEYGLNAAVAGAGFTAGAYDPAMVTTDISGCAAGFSQTNASGPTGSLFNQGGTNLGGINSNCNYTNIMNGTSSASPMMSGTIALVLEANPALTWREVKDILAKTTIQVDTARAGVTVALSDGSYVAEQPWITNAAGYKFHNWYGFGAVNASAAVNMAKSYVSGSLGTFANTGWIAGTLPATTTVPDNSVAGVSATFTVPAVGVSGTVEALQVQVTTSATGGYTGDLGIELVSPSGTKSILKNIKDGFNGNNLNGMVLASNAFYGENSAGTWTIKVVDGWAGSGIQTLTNVAIRVYGH